MHPTQFIPVHTKKATLYTKNRKFYRFIPVHTRNTDLIDVVNNYATLNRMNFSKVTEQTKINFNLISKLLIAILNHQ